MLKIRYSLIDAVLTGWDDAQVRPGVKEAVATLSIDKPIQGGDDYENFIFKDGLLKPSGKTPSRNLAAEIDDLKARLTVLEPKEL